MSAWRHWPRSHDHEQPALPLDTAESDRASNETALRAAYEELDARVKRKWTFEQAMADPALAIGITNMAAFIARRKKETT